MRCSPRVFTDGKGLTGLLRKDYDIGRMRPFVTPGCYWSARDCTGSGTDWSLPPALANMRAQSSRSVLKIA